MKYGDPILQSHAAVPVAKADWVPSLSPAHGQALDQAGKVSRDMPQPQTAPSLSPARPARRIAHLDMDAFYASVELLRYPQLKGLPVVIGGGRRREDEALAGRALADIGVDQFPRLKDYVGRGVITTATYAARQFGVGSAMGLMKAAKLCPQAILLPVDFEEIRR